MSDYADWVTLRDLDTAAGRVKGAAFRAFKRLLPTLQEHCDFVVLDHQRDAGTAARLHAAQRLYRSSLHPVLLAPAAAARVRERLADAPEPDR